MNEQIILLGALLGWTTHWSFTNLLEGIKDLVKHLKL